MKNNPNVTNLHLILNNLPPKDRDAAGFAIEKLVRQTMEYRILRSSTD